MVRVTLPMDRMVAVVSLLLFVVTGDRAPAATRPNVLLVLADNMGYGGIQTGYMNDRRSPQQLVNMPKGTVFLEDWACVPLELGETDQTGWGDDAGYHKE